METRRCTDCNKSKSLSEFVDARDDHRKLCRDCLRQARNRHRRKWAETTFNRLRLTGRDY